MVVALASFAGGVLGTVLSQWAFRKLSSRSKTRAKALLESSSDFSADYTLHPEAAIPLLDRDLSALPVNSRLTGHVVVRIRQGWLECPDRTMVFELSGTPESIKKSLRWTLMDPDGGLTTRSDQGLSKRQTESLYPLIAAFRKATNLGNTSWADSDSPLNIHVRLKTVTMGGQPDHELRRAEREVDEFLSLKRVGEKTKVGRDRT